MYKNILTTVFYIIVAVHYYKKIPEKVWNNNFLCSQLRESVFDTATVENLFFLQLHIETRVGT